MSQKHKKSSSSIFMNLKIKTRLIAGFTSLVIIFLVNSFFLKLSLGRSAIRTEELYQSVVISKVSIDAKNDISHFDEVFDEVLELTNKGEFNDAVGMLDSDIKKPALKLNSRILQMKKILDNSEENKMIIDIENIHKEWKIMLTAVNDNLKNENSGQVKKEVEKIRVNMKIYIEKLDSLKIYTDNVSKIVHQENSIEVIETQKISTLIVIATLILSMIIAILISQNILKSLSLFKNIFVKGSSGDLNAKYPVNEKGKDEINVLGIMFNNFLDKLNDVITEVADVANDLGVSSEQLSATTSTFSDNSQSQAATSEEITATMEEVTAGVNNISNNTQMQHDKLNEVISLMKELSEEINVVAERISRARVQSKEITEQAKIGSEALNLMTSSMDEISKSSSEVTDIIQIINSISGEINLLSLNAAIEAARAGESGRGFAVVADEISKLADQTAESISQIDSLIDKNNNEIQKGMQNVDDTISGISRIIEGVEAIDGMMTNIIADVQKQQGANKSVNSSVLELKNLSDEVKFSAEEQRTAATEIMKSMSNINNMIQSGAGGAEEIAGNVDKLSSMADNLKDKITFFKLFE